MTLRLHHLPPLVLALLLGFLGCSRRDLADMQPRDETIAPAAASQSSQLPNNDCWYCKLDEEEMLAVWLSPRLPGQVEGGFRFVNVMYHDASRPEPIFLRSTPVRNVDGDPVQIQSGRLVGKLGPSKGKTWQEVRTQADLQVDLTTP